MVINRRGKDLAIFICVIINGDKDRILTYFCPQTRTTLLITPGTHTPRLTSLFTALLFVVCQAAFSQSPTDSLSVDSPTPPDSTNLPGIVVEEEASDSLSTDKPVHKGSTAFLDDEVRYQATDSLAFDFETKQMSLYGDAKIEYGDITLTAYQIVLDMDSTTAYACGRRDSTGTEVGLPVFVDKSGEYTMREMRYNFETKKAIITHIVTEQGEGYVVGNKAKRVDEETYFMRNAKYTTCDRHDHPHFYLNLTKAKVIPGKKTVTGPAYLVVEDVPLPVALPFAIIPTTKSYSSGIVIPSYGDESTRGFYLQNGGYYWAANQYFDLKVLADIYTKGSWGLHVSSTYKKRYKFSGSFAADYLVNITSEKDLPDYAKTKDFSVKWSHSQDSKANPDQTFSASVNISTSSYNRNSVTNKVDPNTLATNQKSSSISYSRKWSWNPFRLTASLSHSQNSRDTSISLTLPDINITSSRRFYPFKPKNTVGSKSNPIYDINLNYTLALKNSVSCKESELSFSGESLTNDWKNGIKHTIPITTNIKFLKYFSMSPSFNYTERWYTSKRRQYWDKEQQKIITTDPISGFNRAYDFNFSVSTSTKIYTFYRPIRALFGDKINAIRHVATPSIGFTYTPDFSKDMYGFYDSFQYYSEAQDKIIDYKYSYYNGYVFGTPGSSESGSLSLSLGNTLEMKVKSDADTTGFKKISILESLSFSTSYNMLADSLKWNYISMSGRTKIFGTSVSFNASFDPYGYASNTAGTAGIRINKSAWKVHRKPLIMRSASLSFSFQLSPDTFKKKDGKDQNDDEEDDEDEYDEDWALHAADSQEISPGAQMPHNRQEDDSRLTKGDDGYAAFSMPWSLSFSYSFRLAQGTFNPETCLYKKKVTSSVNVSGNVSLTPKWKISVSSGYSFDEKKLSQTSIGITRDLHCWSMNFNLVPTGSYKSYNFSIAINSSMLKDLKYQQSNSSRDNSRY